MKLDELKTLIYFKWQSLAQTKIICTEERKRIFITIIIIMENFN